MKHSAGKKTVTFRDPIPEPRVESGAGDMQLSPKTSFSPRVVENKPTIAKAVIDKPLRTIPPRVMATKPTTAKVVIDKPLRIIPTAGPTTRSKYAQALAYITKRGPPTRNKPQLDMTELAQAIIDDNPTLIESANEVFDEASGKLLRYRKLITHPQYREVWLNSSAN